MRIWRKKIESFEFSQDLEAQAIMLSKLFHIVFYLVFYIWAYLFAYTKCKSYLSWRSY